MCICMSANHYQTSCFKPQKTDDGMYHGRRRNIFNGKPKLPSFTIDTDHALTQPTIEGLGQAY